MKLHLIVKKKWYDMIVSGEKREEYRLRNLHWHQRIMKNKWYIDSVVFHLGYTKVTHERECVKITEGFGKKEWGAPEKEVIIIKLGKEINENN